MKKLFSILFVIGCLLCSVLKTQAMTFDEAFSKTDKTPMVVLVYANWADGYQTCLNAFREVESQLGDSFNYVELDIASKDAKSYNSKYPFQQNIPYVMVYRNMGKVSRILNSDCAKSSSCIIHKIKTFLQ